MADHLLPASKDNLLPQIQLAPPELNGRAETLYAQPAPSDDGMDLGEVLRAIRAHMLLIFGVTAVVTALGGWLAFRAKPIFEANAVIRINDERSQLTEGISPQQTVNPFAVRTDPVLSEIQVLKSRAVAAQVIAQHPLGIRIRTQGVQPSELTNVQLDTSVAHDTLQLTLGADHFTVRDDTTAVTSAYGSPARLGGLTFTLPHAPRAKSGAIIIVPSAVAENALLLDLNADPRQNTDVVDVSYKGADPRTAQEIVNTAVQTFQQMSADDAQDQSRRRAEFIRTQLAETDSILEQAQLALSNFATTKQVYGSDQVIAAEQSGVMDLDKEAGQLSADRTMYQGLLDSLRVAKGQPLTERLNAAISSPDIAANPLVQALYQQLLIYESARDSLTTGPWASAPRNPDVLRVDSLITLTQHRLIGATQSEVDALGARIAALQLLKNQTAHKLQQLPAMQASEARLTEQVEAARSVSDQLRAEYQKARIEEAAEAGQVQIVDLAPLPLRAISRGPLFRTGIALVLGLILGVAGALITDRLNTAIRAQDEIESLLRVPRLAMIPRILPARGPRGWVAARSAAGGGNGTQLTRVRAEPALVAVNDMRSSGAEAFRSLRTSLIFSQAAQSLRTLVVTSSAPQEGKTTTIANLAITFAQQGLRVVLVDCDLRRARLHNVFGLSREPGLTTAMLGQVSLDSVIRATEIENLWFLPAGALPPNPAELLGGPLMRDIIQQLRHAYDIVLIDTPPLHAASDAQILGRQSDGVVMVVRAGKTDKASAQDAVRLLNSVGARVVGAVLNDPDQKLHNYGGYYYAEYYGSDEPDEAVTAR